jgi:hypothetical protein
MKMKTLLIVMGIAFLYSCAPQTVVPSIPQYETKEGKACARECQFIYTQCNDACSEMVGDAITTIQRRWCLNNCNITIGDCYTTCE